MNSLTILGKEHNPNTEIEVFNENEFGFKVTVQFTPESWYPEKTLVLNNVTEVHNLYSSLRDNKSIAFESDLHGTGMTKEHKDILSVTVEHSDKLEEEY